MSYVRSAKVIFPFTFVTFLASFLSPSVFGVSVKWNWLPVAASPLTDFSASIWAVVGFGVYAFVNLISLFAPLLSVIVLDAIFNAPCSPSSTTIVTV